MFRILAVVALAANLGATTLQAATIFEDTYVGAGIAGKTESGSFGEGLEKYSDAEDNGWKLFVGTRIGEHLAVEIAHLDLGTQRCCAMIADLGYMSTVDGETVSVLGRWPLTHGAPFVKIGVLSWSENGEFISLIGPSPESDKGTDLLFGAGIEVDLANHLAIRAEWERYEFEEISSDGVWAALLFRF